MAFPQEYLCGEKPGVRAGDGEGKTGGASVNWRKAGSPASQRATCSRKRQVGRVYQDFVIHMLTAHTPLN